MIASNQIKADAPVVCSKDGQFGVVDHMQGSDVIKLKKDKSGQHHYIPLHWVNKVDEKVHVRIPGDQAMKEWSTTPSIADSNRGTSDENRVGVVASETERGFEDEQSSAPRGQREKGNRESRNTAN